MSVLLFIEHSVEVAHGKTSCKFSQTAYLRIGRSRGQGAGVGKARGGALAECLVTELTGRLLRGLP